MDTIQKYFGNLNLNGEIPVYKQLEEGISAFIHAHPDRTLFPSERELSITLSLNRATVRKAIAPFLKSGILRRTQKSTIVNKLPAQTETTASYIGFERISMKREAVLAVPEYSVALWRNIAEEFSREHHPVRVIPRGTNDNPFRYQDGENVDFQLLMCNPAIYGDQASTFHFIDLTQMLKEIPAEEYYPQMLVRDLENRIWGVAPTLAIPVFTRNSALFPDGVVNWDFETMKEIVFRLRRTLALPYIFSFFGYGPFFYNLGIRFIDPATGKFHLDEERLSNPLHDLKELYRKGCMSFIDEQTPDLLQQLAAKQLVMTECNSKFVLDHLEEISKKIDLDFLPSPNRSCYIISSEIFALTAASQYHETAMDFIRFVLTAEMQRKIASASHLFPVRRDVVPDHFPQGMMRVFSEIIPRAEYNQEFYRIDNRLQSMIEVACNRWFRYGGSYSGMVRELRGNIEFYLKNRREQKLI